MNQQFHNLLQKLQAANPNVQCAELQDIAAATQNASKTDLKELLELLNTTNNIELQVKLFSILAGYLLSKNVNCAVIITCKPLYDKIQDILNKGLPLRTTTVLNFILALLSFDAEEKLISLAIFARNMIRVSGCLSNMSSLLTSSMMYQDTWIALCHSFAKACRGSEVNQSYCSHLVPFCVQSCLQGNIEVFCVLQSLLHNHERNIQLFLEANGVSIFTREFLQHETCMQLLNTIVQKSSQAITILRTTNVLNDLRDLQRLSGPLSQIGQWSTIIMYYLNCGINKKEEIVTEPDVAIADNASIPESSNQNKDDKIFHNVSIRPEFEETKNLFQNVIKEVLQWNSQNKDNNFKIPYIPNSSRKDSINRSHSLQRNNMRYFLDNHHKTRYTGKENVYPKGNGQSLRHDKNKSVVSKKNEQESSFLFKPNFQQTNINSNNETKDIYLLNRNLENHKFIKTYSNATKQTMRDSYAKSRADNSDFYATIEHSGGEKYSDVDLRNFKPTFVSTPKRLIVEKQNVNIQPKRLFNNDSEICKQKRSRKKPPAAEKTKQRSMSARLFNAVNESCTTLVKSVKSIFQTKENTNNPQNETINLNAEAENIENLKCSYSFTDYMRKRDAILAGNCTETDIYNDFSIDMRRNTCKTCSDTIMLQNKLDNNEQLKKTMMKLKMGINLYGCDFRKISKVMWPRERYMTPKVLNNLYRKLILK